MYGGPAGLVERKVAQGVQNHKVQRRSRAESAETYLHPNSLAVEWGVAINIHNWSRYVTVISRDIRVYCGRFVGPSRTVRYMDGPPTKNIK